MIDGNELVLTILAGLAAVVGPNGIRIPGYNARVGAPWICTNTTDAAGMWGTRGQRSPSQQV